MRLIDKYLLLCSFVLPSCYENSSLFGDLSISYGTRGSLNRKYENAMVKEKRERYHWRLLQRGTQFIMTDALRNRRHELNDVAKAFDKEKRLSEEKISLRAIVYLDPFEPISSRLFQTIVYAAQQHSEKWYSPQKFIGGESKSHSSLSIVLLTQQAENVQLLRRKGDVSQDLQHCQHILRGVEVPDADGICTGEKSGLFVIPIPEDYLSISVRIDHYSAQNIPPFASGARQDKKAIAADLLDEATERAFQLNVRKVLDASDADLIIIPRKR